MTRLLFVGERRSPTAIARGWTWRSGRLAAKTLHEALRACGIDPAEVGFCNLWPDASEVVTPHRRRALRGTDRLVVALGAKVAAELRVLGIPHVAVIHPAARGWIRGRGRYAEHVRVALHEALS